MYVEKRAQSEGREASVEKRMQKTLRELMKKISKVCKLMPSP